MVRFVSVVSSKATADGLHSVGNVAKTALAFITMGPKSVAKRMATSSVKQSSRREHSTPTRDNRFAWMFEDLNDAKEPEPQTEDDGWEFRGEHQQSTPTHESSATFL